MLTVNPMFCSQKSIVAPKKQPKTSSEIFQERTTEEARIAKEKPAEERTVGDYLVIGLDTIHNMTENVPVIHANSTQKLNYLA